MPKRRSCACLFDPNAIVFNPEPHPARLFFRPNQYFRQGCPSLNELDCVTEQVGKDLRQGRGVGLDLWQGHFYFDVTLGAAAGSGTSPRFRAINVVVSTSRKRQISRPILP